MAKRIKAPRIPSLEKPYEYFDLLYPMRQRDRKKIESILIERHPVNPAPYAILDYVLSPVLGKTTPICKSVVVEYRYYDRDHARAFSTFYSRSFRDVPKECTRLHFFSRRLSAADLSNLEDQINSYLGFLRYTPLSY